MSPVGSPSRTIRHVSPPSVDFQMPSSSADASMPEMMVQGWR